MKLRSKTEKQKANNRKIQRERERERVETVPDLVARKREREGESAREKGFDFTLRRAKLGIGICVVKLVRLT